MRNETIAEMLKAQFDDVTVNVTEVQCKFITELEKHLDSICPKLNMIDIYAGDKIIPWVNHNGVEFAILRNKALNAIWHYVFINSVNCPRSPLEILEVFEKEGTYSDWGYNLKL